MKLHVEGRVVAVEFWKYSPGKAERTRPRRLETPEIVQRIQRILQSQMSELEFCAEPPDNPRYIVKLHYQRRKPIAVKVNGTVVMTADRCFHTKNSDLWKILEQHVSRQKETVDVPGKPCFVRIRS